jgi:hypothetical protein
LAFHGLVVKAHVFVDVLQRLVRWESDQVC